MFPTLLHDMYVHRRRYYPGPRTLLPTSGLWNVFVPWPIFLTKRGVKKSWLNGYGKYEEFGTEIMTTVSVTSYSHISTLDWLTGLFMEVSFFPSPHVVISVADAVVVKVMPVAHFSGRNTNNMSTAGGSHAPIPLSEASRAIPTSQCLRPEHCVLRKRQMEEVPEGFGSCVLRGMPLSDTDDHVAQSYPCRATTGWCGPRRYGLWLTFSTISGELDERSLLIILRM